MRNERSRCGWGSDLYDGYARLAIMSPMEILQIHLTQLLSWVQNKEQCPAWSHILFIEDMDIIREKVEDKYTATVPRRALFTPEQYSSRFDELMNSGFSWINMSAAGILDKTLIIIIEFPRSCSAYMRHKTPVNFSQNVDWDVSKWLRVGK